MASGNLAAPLLLGSLLLAAASCRAEATTDDLGPSVLTLPELAARMSRPGDEVRCAPELRNRAAFVYLKARTRPQQRDLLAAGLGVRFRRVDAGWTVDWDAELRRTERARLSRYAGHARARLREIVGRKIAALGTRTHPELEAALEAYRERLRAESLGGFGGDAGLGRDSGALSFLPTAAEQQAEQWEAVLRPAGWRALALFRDPLHLEPWLRAGWTVQVTRDDDPADLMPFNRVTSAPAQDPLPRMIRPDILALGTWLDPIDRAVHVCAEYATLEGRDDDPRSEVSISWEEERLPQAFAALGLQDERWRAGQVEATAAFLHGREGQAEFRIEAPGRIDSVSQLIEQWSRQRDREAVMLLWPQREGLDRLPHEASVRLSDWYGEDGRARLFARELNRGFGHRPTVAELQAGAALAANADPADGSPWTLTERDGALLVTNQLAFLDRETEYPTAALVRLQRSLRWPEANTGDGNPSLAWQEWRRYARSVAPSENGTWWRLASVTYRGLNLEGLSSSTSVADLLDGNSLAQRATVYPALCRGEAVERPLARLSGARLLRLVSALRSEGITHAQAWHPGFARCLPGLTLEARSRPQADGSFDLSLQLLDLPPNLGPQREWLPRLILPCGKLRLR